MKSSEVLREAIDKVGAKTLAAKLNVSPALIYKWCQQAPRDEGRGGALNPLDRVKDIYDQTGDARLINWLCRAAGGFFTPNPAVKDGDHQEHLLGATQRMVRDFGGLLEEVSRSIENDGQITHEEAKNIRQSWEQLKGQAESFVVACEKGKYRHKRE